MLTPQGGQVLLEGKNLSTYSRREMSRLVGLVPQIEHIPFEFSVMEYVLLGRAPYLGILQMPSEEDYQTVLEILQALKLTHLAHRVVLDLSGGERQMVLLARAMAQQPRILLLDEPTSHLDLSNKGHILRILRDLAAQGVTVIFTTHDPYTAVLSAHYLILMREGRILDTGPIEQVLKSDKLTSTYGVPVRVVKVEGYPVILLDETLR
jgi:iron complex transport system ATP-binding protein